MGCGWGVPCSDCDVADPHPTRVAEVCPAPGCRWLGAAGRRVPARPGPRRLPHRAALPPTAAPAGVARPGTGRGSAGVGPRGVLAGQVELREDATPEVVAEMLQALEREGAALLARRREVDLVSAPFAVRLSFRVCDRRWRRAASALRL